MKKRTDLFYRYSPTPPFAGSSVLEEVSEGNKKPPCCLQNPLEQGSAGSGGGDWCCLGYPGNNPFKMVDARSGEGRGGHLLWKIIWFCALGPVGFQKFITTGGKKKKRQSSVDTS